VLELRRSEDEKNERTFWWRLQGRVELVPWNERDVEVLPGMSALVAGFKARQVRGANYEPPIKKYLESLAGRIKLPGFRRPKALRQYDCRSVRACGPWRLRVDGQSLLAESGEGLRTVVVIPEKFAQRADLEGSVDAKTMSWLREGLRLMEITAYELEAASVFVLNLAVGDYHSTYGEDEPPPTTEASPMKLLRECQGVACYYPAYTMHHGNHLEASLVSRGSAR
jgi:hypothetical protein